MPPAKLERVSEVNNRTAQPTRLTVLLSGAIKKEEKKKLAFSADMLFVSLHDVLVWSK